jgi:hypothetical protein
MNPNRGTLSYKRGTYAGGWLKKREGGIWKWHLWGILEVLWEDLEKMSRDAQRTPWIREV